MSLSQLRLDLARAKEALRQAKDDLETAKTIATMHTTGANAEERKKADAQALASDRNYQHALEQLRVHEAEVERYEALIDGLRDERTARELSIREENNRVLDRLAAAYEALARTNPIRAAIDAGRHLHLVRDEP